MLRDAGVRLTGRVMLQAVLCGPGDVRDAHAPDEPVAVSELVDVTHTLVRLTASVCATR